MRQVVGKKGMRMEGAGVPGGKYNNEDPTSEAGFYVIGGKHKLENVEANV